MADPDSSIKSIFSGKVSLNDTDDEFGSQILQNNKSAPQSSSNLGSMRPVGDHDSVSSQNLRFMAQADAGAGKNELFATSTNVSVASSCSDYQHPFAADTDSFSLATNQGLISEGISRPGSRNSMTSCLSTTATKDGVEGKKIHRHGPSPYFANVISNMVHQQQANAPPMTLRTSSYQGTVQEPPKARKADIDAVSQPQVTLQEKVMLMNMDNSKRL